MKKTIERSSHGMYKSPEYKTWDNMITRCTRPSHKHYKHYGGRGIYICSEWRKSFLAFYSYVGPKPTPKHTIERIDSNLGYEPGNVKWATSKEQGRNTSRNVLLTVNGTTKTKAEWAEELGINYSTVNNRLWQGKSLEEALAPVNPKMRNGLARSLSMNQVC